ADQGDKVGAEDRAAVEAALAELKDALNGSDIDRMNNSTESLNAASQKMSQSLYEQAAAQPDAAAAGDAASGGTSDDEVVDAEIIEDDK
ncbi:MAG: molecular chaperone DnaK, partial [Microthrixaceae bacterium]